MARRYADQGLSVLQGYAIGSKFVRDWRADRADAEVREKIAGVDADFQPQETPVASGEDAYAAGQQAYKNAMAGVQTPEQQAEVARQYQPTLQALSDQRATPSGIVRSMGVGNAFQQREQPFSPRDVQDAKAQARAAVYQGAGREDEAARVLQNAERSRQAADQAELRSALAVPSSQARTPAASGIGMDELTGGQAQPANSPAGIAGRGAPALRDPLDHYLKEVAPQAISTLVKQGHVEQAKHFADFIDSREGRAYAQEYVTGLRQFAIGDHEGALKSFEALYNNQLPDGRQVKLTALDGDQMRVDQIDAQGKVVGTRTGKISDLTEQAALALNPMQAVKFHSEQQAKRKSEGALLDRQVQLEGMRQQGQETREDRRDERMTTRLDAQSSALERRLAAQSEGLDKRLSSRGGLTAAQERSNAEIDAAREATTGLSTSEIMRRTAKATNTGRENPDYDPALARQAALANRRKVGDDELFDRREVKPAAPSFDRADIAKRFRANKAMNSRTLGKETPQGVEVLEGGKLIGYFR